jgi:hypothetical protein
MSHQINKEAKAFTLKHAFWGSLALGSVLTACAEERRETVYNNVIAQDRSVVDLPTIMAAGDQQLKHDTLYQVFDKAGLSLVLVSFPIGFAWGAGSLRRRKEQEEFARSTPQPNI